MRGIYQAALNDKPLTDRLIAAVPAAEHLAPVEMVKAGGRGGRLPGTRGEETWRAARANQPEAASPLARRADAAIKRLAR